MRSVLLILRRLFYAINAVGFTLTSCKNSRRFCGVQTFAGAAAQTGIGSRPGTRLIVSASGGVVAGSSLGRPFLSVGHKRL